MFKVLHSIEEIKDIRDCLEQIFNSHQEGFNFYTPKYVIDAYQYFINTKDKSILYFIICKNQNEITHYIPLYIDKRGCLRFIFDKHTDYCDIIGGRLEHDYYKNLVKLLEKDNRIKRFDFDNLFPDNELLAAFKHYYGPAVNISIYNNHSYIYGTRDKGFYSHLKSKQKSELKRVNKRNQKYRFVVYSEPEPFPEKDIIDIRDAMIANKSRSIDFLTDSFLNFTKELYNNGELELFVKKDKEKLVSCSMVLKRGNYRMVWMDLYMNIKYLNLSAYVDYINFLEQQPPKYFSFGRGSYDYKAKNFHPKIQNLCNLRYSKNKLDFLFTNYYPLRQFIKRSIKQ